jgi:glycosyltransferase involved in cell wall biosynthesis
MPFDLWAPTSAATGNSATFTTIAPPGWSENGWDMPRVSVIIPLYNGERFIRETLQSVLSQTYRDFEIVVVDDGSTDQGKNIVLGMKGPIKYIVQQNSGVCAARNQGFLHSQGNYIAFIDQDDQWYPQNLAVQVKLLDDGPDRGIVYADLDLIDDCGQMITRDSLRSETDPSSRLLRFLKRFPEFPDPFPYPSACVIPREVFLQAGMFDVSFKRNCHEDTELWFRIAKKRLARFFFHPQSLVQRRIHPAQGGRDEEAFEENWVTCLRKLVELYNDEPKKKAYLKRRLARIYFKKGKHLLESADVSQARACFRLSASYDPFYWRNWKRLMGSYLKR